MAGAIEAHRRTKIERFVTVAMREVIFHQPVFVGDLVSFYAETVRIGTTSITVRVIVEAERYGGTSDRIRVTEAEVIYVAVDANRQKMKINKEGVRGMESAAPKETS
jgi:acyl-CoA thioesterase YciA